MNRDQFYERLNSRFSLLTTGEPMSHFVSPEGTVCRYVTFALTGAPEAELWQGLWDVMSPKMPKHPTVLVWRMAPEVTYYNDNVWDNDAPAYSKEMVEDGLVTLPADYVLCPWQGVFRHTLGTAIVTEIYSRVWWPGLTEGNKREEEAIPPITRRA